MYIQRFVWSVKCPQLVFLGIIQSSSFLLKFVERVYKVIEDIVETNNADGSLLPWYNFESDLEFGWK